MFANPQAYERYIGRWSARLAPLLVDFADIGNGSWVLDVGSGTGNLSLAVAENVSDASVVGIDQVADFVDCARMRTVDSRIRFAVGDGQDLPCPEATFDACLASLVLQSVPDASRAMAEMRRVTRPGGRVVASVWDFSASLTMLSGFWDAALEVDPDGAQKHRERPGFRYQAEFAALWRTAGLEDIRETALEVGMTFDSFEDFWSPFLEGSTPATIYASGLHPGLRRALGKRLRERLLGTSPDRPFTLPARAWGVRGTVPIP